jgi:hypothetical protein
MLAEASKELTRSILRSLSVMTVKSDMPSRAVCNMKASSHMNSSHGILARVLRSSTNTETSRGGCTASLEGSPSEVSTPGIQVWRSHFKEEEHIQRV